MDIQPIYRLFQGYFRPRRIGRIRRELPILRDPNCSILDMGGTASWWVSLALPTKNITIINIDNSERESCEAAGYRFEVADGRALPFADKEFDLVFSNSVIEHVGNQDDQRRFAAEIVRCGKAHYVQTPNKWFPIEPHMITVFLHWLPAAVQRKLVRWLSVWGLVSRPSQKVIDDFLRDTRLLDRTEMLTFFPQDRRADEKFLGLSKSFVAIHGG